MSNNVSRCSQCGLPLELCPAVGQNTEEVDNVNSPKHYNAHPSGVECIVVTEHMNFCRGNAMKYLWRAGEKGGPEQEVEDLKKARWYLDREIGRLERRQK
jgi:hypothetical protein